ncbi:hypothetical protein QWY31_14475 [Cytophagales bacterium LB-30]|uniref:Uncharacterized protein n=1 Tax=Shiella aurantiaca TaxID=3058365 RepID=A0ABT8F8V6_9BACT|nr:hypothetical protein [Shiella aurantiaca]MDN4166713.1 hypothetical protein [Shiella aurantiaca]
MHTITPIRAVFEVADPQVRAQRIRSYSQGWQLAIQNYLQIENSLSTN